MINGIDVSKYQGVINWQAVKASGKSFVFVRLGWAGYDGRIADNGGLDEMFKINAEGAAAAGLNVGVYVYFYAKTPEAAKIAAKETLRLVSPYKLSYPIAFDIEDNQYCSVAQKSSNTAIADAFLTEIAAGGYTPLLYTYKSFAESFLNMPALSQYDFWVAQYSSVCTYKEAYTIWQHTGDAGRCEGVNGPCDLNTAYKDYAAPAGTDYKTLYKEAQERIDKMKNFIAGA